jgi:hypothetical protein
MTKTYRKPRTFTRADATRKTLREYAANNRLEKRIGTTETEMAKVARHLRARLVAESPTSPDTEIDAKVARIISAGQCQTTEQPLRLVAFPRTCSPLGGTNGGKRSENGGNFGGR